MKPIKARSIKNTTEAMAALARFAVGYELVMRRCDGLWTVDLFPKGKAFSEASGCSDFLPKAVEKMILNLKKVRSCC